ncbi:MAG TPA: DUF1592 domain-containing protein [Vicinamibacterales bacterium]|jgi:mono/diheme cytochrome c family protein|nr:DUF1592 domain-containing protein [Vicinamibacterales bacterium]
MRRLGVAAALIAAITWGWAAPHAADLTSLRGSDASADPAAAATPASPPARSTINRYCIGCHNARAKTAGLELDSAALDDVAANPDVWEKVIRKVRGGMMPPAGAPQPDQATRQALVAGLEATLDRAALTHLNPGRPLVHRLNRTEYANAIRDLLALDVDVTSLLPPDDSASGFDNNADVLGVSPVLLESYLTAAERVSALALGDPHTPPAGEVYRVRQDASQDEHIEGLPLGTVGGILIHPTLPLDGEYQFQVKLFRTNLGTMRGLEYQHQLEIAVDGERVHLATFGGDAEIRASSDNPTTTGDRVDGRFTTKIPLTAGPHEISVAFLERTHALNTRRLQNYVRSSSDTIDFSGLPHIDQVILTGPFTPAGPGDTPSRRRIFVCKPTDSAGSDDDCARRMLSTIARRAYRGDVTADDLRAIMSFFEQGRREGQSFDSGIDLALRRVLASPKFVFRVEPDPPAPRATAGRSGNSTARAVSASDAPPSDVYRLDDLALASRLSFFLWSSIPDDELLALAGSGKLTKGDTLEKQVRRMLEDPKAESIVDNFAGQWLQLRNLKSKQPNSHEFPDFDDDLRQALLTEMNLFFGSIMREDRNILDLMTADYTFVNERLAKHYGIPNVYGSHFRRITLPDDTRRGLLGKGAILMVTSHPHRTSPVLRGKFVLDNLLGTPPPPPPDVVPAFPEDLEPQKPRSVRERLEQHRRNPSCASCHRLIDPAGLALENFDAVGAWRTRDGGTRGTPVDASGQLADGTRVTGVVELRQALLRDPQTFVRTVTERLMTYALGRSLAGADMPAVRTVVRDAAKDNYRFSSIVLGIVRSVPFTMRTRAAAARTQSAAR